MASRSGRFAGGTLLVLAGATSLVKLLVETEVWHAQAWGKLIGITLILLLGTYILLRDNRKLQT